MSNFVRKYWNRLVKRRPVKPVAQAKTAVSPNKQANRARREVIVRTSRGELHLMLSEPNPSIW